MKAKVNGVELNYLIEGEGPWLTMSHSLACDSSMWDEEAKRLSQRFRVLRVDTRGHGGSEATAGAYTLDQLAADFHALFAHLGIKQSHWVGLSMGGMIGQVFALNYPGVLQSLVLADTTSRYPAAAASVWSDRIRSVREKGMGAIVDSTLTRWFTEPFRKEHPQVVERIAQTIRNTPVNGYVGCSEAIPKIDVTARLRQITCPVLVLVGAQDPGTPPEMAAEIRDNLPGAQLIVIDSAAHLANLERPAAFYWAMEQFYDRIKATA